MRLTAEGAATRLEGPLLFLRRTLEVGLYDAVEVRGRDGRARLGRVAAIDRDFMTIEVLESTSWLALAETVVRFFGEPLSFGLSPGILGRVFNGVGQVIDGGPPVAARASYPIEGLHQPGRAGDGVDGQAVDRVGGPRRHRRAAVDHLSHAVEHPAEDARPQAE